MNKLNNERQFKSDSTGAHFKFAYMCDALTKILLQRKVGDPSLKSFLPA